MKSASVMVFPLIALLVLSQARAEDSPKLMPGNCIVPEQTNLWAQIVWAPPTSGLHLGILLIRSTANLLLRSDVATNAPHWYAPPGFRRFQAELRDASGAAVGLRDPTQFAGGIVYTNLRQIPKNKHAVTRGFLSPPLRGAICYTNLELPGTFRIRSAGDYVLRVKGRVVLGIPKSRGDLARIEFPWVSLRVRLNEKDLGPGEK